jgi:hypothetical protein
MRLDTTQRSKWAQLRIGACALLLPPLTLGAALFSMLAPPEDGATVPPGAAAEAQAVRQPWAADAEPQPVAQTIQPIAFADNAAHPQGRNSAPAAGAQPETATRSAEAPGQALIPVRVRVTAASSPGLNPPPPQTAGRAPTGSPGAEPSQSAPAEVSTTLLPRALSPSGQASPQIRSPRMLPAQMLAAQAPLVDLSLADRPPAPSAAPSKPARPSSPAAAHRSHTHAVRRWYAQQRHQHEFSFRDWFQQRPSVRANNTRG